jgi:membrane dipeptidase
VRSLTRRGLLGAGLGAAGALAAGCTPRREPVPVEAAALHREALVFDLHIDTLLWMRFLGYDLAARHENRLPGAPFAWHMDLPRAREGGLDGAVLGLVISPREVRDELIAPLKLLARLEADRGIDQTLRTLDVAADAAHRLPRELAFCRSGSELRAAMTEGRFAVLAGLEGSHGIESDLANVRAAHERGLRMIGLTHFQASSAAYPMTVSAFDGQGLTDFGRELLSEMERLRMVVDIAHVNGAGVDEVLARIRQPFVVSHSACHAVHPDSRNLSDDQIRRIADKGGVIGLAVGRTFVGRPGVAGFLDHVEHALRVGGADCVAIGSDWDGAITPVEGLEDVASLPRLTAGLLARGHEPAVIQKFLGDNALRVITEVCG